MIARQPLPLRANGFATCAVILVAGMAATLQPAAAASVQPDGTILLPPALVAASADTDGGPRRLRDRGPGRDGERQAGPERERPTIDKKLTNDQVRDIVAGRLAQSGNANLKVGKVTAKEDSVVSVEIVTKTGALVDTREISTKTGMPAGAERRFGEMRHRFSGKGMMAHRGGRGPGMGSPGMRGDHRGPENTKDLSLTTDQAKKLAEARLIMRGNPHLKVGAVKEKDADTISVDIVASDNSLVSQTLIDRHTGRPQRPNRS